MSVRAEVAPRTEAHSHTFQAGGFPPNQRCIAPSVLGPVRCLYACIGSWEASGSLALPLQRLGCPSPWSGVLRAPGRNTHHILVLMAVQYAAVPPASFPMLGSLARPTRIVPLRAGYYKKAGRVLLDTCGSPAGTRARICASLSRSHNSAPGPVGPAAGQSWHCRV